MGMNDHGDAGQLRVVPIPRRPGDRWALTSPYVERVSVGAIGPTAALLARRLGFTIDAHPNGARLSIAEVAASLAVPASKVTSSLRRLHHHGLVVFAPDQGLVGVSGFAPSVAPQQLARLSSFSQREHQRLEAEAAGGGESRPERARGVSPQAAGQRPGVARPGVVRSL